MLLSKINLDIIILNFIKKMIFDDVILINIFENGICITQNINNISNLSIFIEKKHLNNHFLHTEHSFVTSDILNLANLEIKKENNKYVVNNQINVVNDVCNVCKKLINLKFPKNEIAYEKLNIDPKLSFLKDNKFDVLISKQFNGIVLKTTINEFTLFINLLYSP